MCHLCVLSNYLCFCYAILKMTFVVLLRFEQGIEANAYGQLTLFTGVTLSLTQLEQMHLKGKKITYA